MTDGNADLHPDIHSSSEESGLHDEELGLDDTSHQPAPTNTSEEHENPSITAHSESMNDTDQYDTDDFDDPEFNPGPCTIPFRRSNFPPRSFISEKTHEAVLAHLATIPPDLTLRNSDGEFDTSTDATTLGGKYYYFLEFYENLCYEDFYVYPPPFHGLVEDLILFYIDVIYPYMRFKAAVPFDVVNSEGVLLVSHLWDILELRFINLIEYLGDPNTDQFRGGVIIAERYRLGLMRPHQIQLLERTYCHMMATISSTLISYSMEDEVDEKVRLFEITRAMFSASKFVRFFGASRFRSERLEVLLMRYIEEDGVDVEVARGVDAEQRKNQDHRLRYLRKLIHKTL